jgi:hypothetical protein
MSSYQNEQLEKIYRASTMGRRCDHVLMRLGKLVRELQNGGVPDCFFEQGAGDGEFDEWLAKQLEERVRRTYNETVVQKEARELLGVNFHGVPEVEHFFGELTDEQRQIADTIPANFIESICAMSPKERKDHILEFDTGVSIRKMRRLARKKMFLDQNWFVRYPFFKDIDQPCWRLIRRTSIKTPPRGLDWNEQCKLVNHRVEYIPSARQVVYMMVLHYLTTRERLDELHTRTSTLHLIFPVLVYFKVDVWHYKDTGICMVPAKDYERRCLITARKPSIIVP